MLSSSPDLSEVRRLEELAFAGWPALETRDVDGWRLRFSGGYTKRANSINALGPDAQIDSRAIDGLEGAYRERRQLPLWRLSPLAPPATADLLGRRGYRAIERSLLQVCPLAATFAAAPEVSIQPAPSAAAKTRASRRPPSR